MTAIAWAIVLAATLHLEVRGRAAEIGGGIMIFIAFVATVCCTILEFNLR